MKSSRFQYEYRKSASKGHIAIGEILRESSHFANYISYQEYPVSRVNPAYSHNSEHFDWVIPQIKLVIEFHGEQHFHKTSFGGKQTEEQISLNFEEMKLRDKNKYNAAINAGYTVIYLTKDDEISAENILKKWRDNYNDYVGDETLTKKEKQKEKYREYQRSQYKLAKERKKNNGIL